MAFVSRRPPSPQRITAGPWRGVVSTNDPFDDAQDTLYDATNIYLPDPAGKCGAYARPGFALYTPAPLDTGSFRGQGVFTHVDLDGTVTNFCVIKGKLYRTDSTFTVFTDVSPVGITISNLTTTRVYGVQFGNEMVITDGVNKPWLMTSFTATPVVGTYIKFNVADTAWNAYGRPTVYGGSLFFILNTVNSVSYRSTLAWSNPADASTGYDQLNYDFTWTIFATGIAPITAIQGTNTALYYGTANTIGQIVGAVGPNLQSTATTAAISVNVGMAIPQTVVLFGQVIFFCDVNGRPWMLPEGQAPVPIYLQMRAILDGSAAAGFPNVTRTVATATLESNFNLYLVAIISSSTSNDGPPTEMYAFDARSGTYEGRWIIGAGVQIEHLGNFSDTNGKGTLICLGSILPPSGSSLAASGYVWGMNGITSGGDSITTENFFSITTEDGLMITTEGSATIWLDNGVVPTITATTNRIGYSVTEMLHVDRANLAVGSASPVTVSMQSASTAFTVESTPTPVSAQDDVFRAVAGADLVGRGITVVASPTTADTQWTIQQVAIDAVAVLAGPDES